ncbi:hypothetical protein AMTR_s00091p00023430 [Amborella trichopoda]|uniref:Uncharacterized protein n=1 Tax=Amborella trichopoda TaxID=13333 RepID=W1NY42_AMBTC|nr:hypothetical protein AMTR_s00091p00023430 [Amborella trichopoda]
MEKGASCPGGPEIPTLLNRRDNIYHRRSGKEMYENPLRIDEKANAAASWPLTNNDQIDLVRRSGLYPLTIVPMSHHDRGTLSIMIERCCAEKNTKYFNIDIEVMMLTLEDAWKIIQLRMTSVVVTLRRVEKYEDYIGHMLGQLPPGDEDAIEELELDEYTTHPHIGSTKGA